MAQDFKGDLFFKLNSNDKQQVKLSSELAFNSSVIHDRFLNQFPSTELVIGDLVSDYEILDKGILNFFYLFMTNLINSSSSLKQLLNILENIKKMLNW